MTLGDDCSRVCESSASSNETVFMSSSPISLSPTLPESASLRITTSGAACWCALIPDSVRVIAHWGANANRGQGGR